MVLKHYKQTRMIQTQNGSKYIARQTLARHVECDVKRMSHVAHVARHIQMPW